MKILYITQEGFDTPNPNNQMAETMIDEFLKSGYQVHLIESHRKGINDDIPEKLKNRDGFSYDVITRKVVDKTRFIRRYLNDYHYAFQAMKRWTKVKDADVIYLQSSPTIIHPMTLLRLFKHSTPIVYSVYDVFPGHALDIGVIKSKFIYNVLRIMQKPCYKMATKITVLGEDMKDKLVKEGAKPSKVHVVPAWYDVSSCKEIKKEENKFLQKYEITDDKFKVGFAGTIGFVFNYKAVLEVAKRLKDEKNIVFQIVGDGNTKEQFITEAKEQCLSNIEFYPLQPRELVPDVYSACDVSIIPLVKGVIGNGVPSKAPLLMACNRPIINMCEIESSYAKQFIQNKMGMSFDVDDYEGCAKGILELKNNPELLKTYAENAKAFGEKEFSSTESLEKLKSVLEEAVTK